MQASNVNMQVYSIRTGRIDRVVCGGRVEHVELKQIAMKKLVLFLGVALLSFNASAQFGTTDDTVYDREYNRFNDPNRIIKYGIRAGLNVANISDDPSITDQNAGIGTEFGVFARIGERFYIQPGADFVNHSINPVRLGERDEVVVRFIRLPLLVGLKSQSQQPQPQFGRNRSLNLTKFRVYAGPSFAFAVGVPNNNINIRRRDVSNAQFALNGGVGLDIWRFGVDVMYHHGLSTVFSDDAAEGKYRNVSLALSLAL